MAEQLKEFDFSTPSTLTTTDKAVYPWETWFDGSIWKLTWGEDFHGHPLMMERIIRTRATGRHAKVSLRHMPTDPPQKQRDGSPEPWGVIVLQRTDDQAPVALKRKARKDKMAATKAANATVNGKATKAKVNGSKPLVHARRVVRKPVNA